MGGLSPIFGHYGLDAAAAPPYVQIMKAPSQNSLVRWPAGLGRRPVAFLSLLRIVLVALMALVPAGCGGGGGSDNVTDPPNPPKPLEVGSGDFNISTWVTFNGCELTKTFLESYSIQIDESGFSMGDWSGSWTAESSSLTASGESEHESVTMRDCTVTTWTTVSLDFTSEDAFTGHVIFRRRAIGGSCECATCTECQSAWGISGVRVVEPTGSEQRY
jgi:hypothetical protein